MKTLHGPIRKPSGWVLATMLGGTLLVALGTGCSSLSEDESTFTDIDVQVPSQAEADATAAQAINEDNADAELQRLDDEVAIDKD